MLKSGQNIVLNQLSSAATSATNSRETSQENYRKRQGTNANRQARRRTPTPGKKKQKSFQHNKKENQKKKSPYRRKSYSQSRSRSNSKASTRSNKSYYKQTSKKQAWKSKICKYWKRGQCKYGDKCEWQHYDFTQIDYCEQKRQVRYNQTYQNEKYLVQITTVSYLSEHEILEMVGKPTQIRQAIAVAIKNKRQSKIMKKEIIKNLKNGQMDEKQKIEAKKKIIQKYMINMQVDTANEIAQKRIQKKEQIKIAQQLQKEKKKNIFTNNGELEMRPQNDQKDINQQIMQRDIFQDYNQQMQYDIEISPKNTQQQKNTTNNYLDFNQNAQQDEKSLDQIHIEENQESTSNLYYDKIPHNQKQQNQTEQQQTQKQITQEIIIQPGQQYKINKTKNKPDPQQRQIKEFFNQKESEKVYTGTGKYTDIMDDKQLEIHYSPGDIDKFEQNKLIQQITTEKWDAEKEQAVRETPKERRDGDQNEEWEKQGLIIVQINSEILNLMLSQQNPTQNPTTSPTNIAKWAIISAILRYLEKKSEYRLIYTSQRMQIFLLNQIIEGNRIKRNTLLITGMDTRAKQQIEHARMNSLCVAIKFN